MKRDISVVGIDIAKRVFHLVGMDERGKIVMRKRCSRGEVLPLLTNGVSRLQTNKYNSTCWPYCHGHALPPSWLKACNPARNGGAHDHHGFYHGVVL
jgi:hypothetical protein